MEKAGSRLMVLMKRIEAKTKAMIPHCQLKTWKKIFYLHKQGREREMGTRYRRTNRETGSERQTKILLPHTQSIKNT